MMNIIGASSLRQVDNSEFLYIGNMADVITNETQLATRLGGVDASDITQFQIIGNDIKCKVSKVFSVLDFENSNISFFVSKFSSLQDNFTGFTGTSKLKSFAHYNSGNAVTDKNFNGSGVKNLFFPNAKICAGYNSLSNLTDTKIYMPSVDTFERIVGGSSNIAAGSSNLTIYKDPSVSYPFYAENFVDIIDTTTPNSVTDLSAVEIGGTYVRINFTEIANADFYELWVYDSGLDTFLFKGEITNNGYAKGFEENTNYQIKIATCDQYWNGSGFFEDENKRAFSNTINVTTTTTPAVFQNAVAYYKLDEISGDAIDVVNGYNGTLFGGVTQGVAGKIGTAYSFNGVDGRVILGNNIWNVIDPENFTISAWASTNEISGQFIFSDLVNVLFSDRRIEAGFSGNTGKIFFTFDDNGNVQISSINDYNLNQLYFITLKYSVPLGIAELKVNNISQGTVAITGNYNRPFNDIYLGCRGTSLDNSLNGITDEVLFINGQTTAGQDSDLYNNGNGTTI